MSTSIALAFLVMHIRTIPRSPNPLTRTRSPTCPAGNETRERCGCLFDNTYGTLKTKRSGKAARGGGHGSETIEPLALASAGDSAHHGRSSTPCGCHAPVRRWVLRDDGQRLGMGNRHDCHDARPARGPRFASPRVHRGIEPARDAPGVPPGDHGTYAGGIRAGDPERP